MQFQTTFSRTLQQVETTFTTARKNLGLKTMSLTNSKVIPHKSPLPLCLIKKLNKIIKLIKKMVIQLETSKNSKFEPPYKSFFKKILMLSFTRKKYHYGTTFIHQKIQKSENKVFHLDLQDMPIASQFRLLCNLLRDQQLYSNKKYLQKIFLFGSNFIDGVNIDKRAVKFFLPDSTFSELKLRYIQQPEIKNSQF